MPYVVRSDGELHGSQADDAEPIPGSPFPENLPEERVELAQSLYEYPASPDGLTTIQSLTATRRPSEGAPRGDKLYPV